MQHEVAARKLKRIESAWSRTVPFVRIGVSESSSAEQRRAIADGVHQAMVEAIGIPRDDRFQLIDAYDSNSMIADSQYLGIQRSNRGLFVQIFLRAGRAVELKQKLYARIADLLRESAQVRREDVFITLTENQLEDWSFGNGVAQYVRR
jgi:4-oxalocrotonate tautomerase